MAVLNAARRSFAGSMTLNTASDAHNEVKCQYTNELFAIVALLSGAVCARIRSLCCGDAVCEGRAQGPERRAPQRASGFAAARSRPCPAVETWSSARGYRQQPRLNYGLCSITALQTRHALCQTDPLLTVPSLAASSADD